MGVSVMVPDHDSDDSVEYLQPYSRMVTPSWVPDCSKMKTQERYGVTNCCHFTGIDHNQRCVTFGAALISDETTESFSWMLEAFFKMHKKQPPFAEADQDGALRNVVLKVFPDSHHRLCMWHITEKLPGVTTMT
ncbi:FAR1-related sequence 5-like protein [Tanacetum coccineum]|uniref:FAR1-related sequence 5-like protein n=1 Tax=Tanacetum coccineum TaxID=301880 RepID=A0ABQ5HIR0_9ASTR